MSSLLRTSRLLELCTPSISYDEQVKAATVAFDPQMYEIIDDTGVVVMIPNIMQINDSNLIDILAWQFHVDFYDHTAPLEFRKQLVQDSIQWHMRKGTRALVEEVLDTYFPGGATLQEWFEYHIPFPPNYPTVSPDTSFGFFGPGNVDTVQNLFILAANHGLTNNDQVRFVTGGLAVSGKLPSPIMAGLFYYVLVASPSSFRVSPSKNGSPVDLLDKGIGASNEIWKRGSGDWHDRYRFRVLIDDRIIDPDAQKIVLELIEHYKPVSRWMEGFVRATVSDCNIGWTGMVLRFIIRFSDKPTNYP